MKRGFWLTVAFGATVVLAVFVQDVSAQQGQLMPYDEFTEHIAIMPTMVCFQFPAQLPEEPPPLPPTPGGTVFKMGVDRLGPFFSFWAVVPQLDPTIPLMFTYRPRGTNISTGPTGRDPGQFGDGMIGAVKCFQEFFERWHRGTTSLLYQDRFFAPQCGTTNRDTRIPHANCFQIVCSTWTHELHVIPPSDWAHGVYLEIVVFPQGPTNMCFEDYEFGWQPN